MWGRRMATGTIERVARGIALALGLVVLTLGVVTPTWWSLLGIVPLVIALSGW